MPKRLISFAPQVFSIPDKPQNEKLVAVMLPFKQLRTFEAVKNVCARQNLDCLKANDIWNNSTFIQEAKMELGLNEYQTRSEEGWLRHMALCMLTQLFITRKNCGKRYVTGSD